MIQSSRIRWIASLGCLLVCTFGNFVALVLVAVLTVNILNLGMKMKAAKWLNTQENLFLVLMLSCKIIITNKILARFQALGMIDTFTVHLLNCVKIMVREEGIWNLQWNIFFYSIYISCSWVADSVYQMATLALVPRRYAELWNTIKALRMLMFQSAFVAQKLCSQVSIDTVQTWWIGPRNWETKTITSMRKRCKSCYFPVSNQGQMLFPHVWKQLADKMIDGLGSPTCY